MPQSPNRNLELQVTGQNSGTWGAINNNAVISVIDDILGSVETINVAGSADVDQTSGNAQAFVQKLTGVLTGSVSFRLLQRPAFFAIDNQSTGAYTITVKTTAGGSAGVIVAQGTQLLVNTDGTNVKAVSADFSNLSYALDSGTASALVATTRANLLGLTTGVLVILKAANSNSATPTLNVNTIGAKPIYIVSGGSIVQAPAASWIAGQFLFCEYDSTLNAGGGGWIATNVIQQSNAFTDTVTITSADAGAAAGPTLDLYRNSASPAASDVLGQVTFTGKDDGGNVQTYGVIDATILDPAAGSEDSTLEIKTVVAGTVATRATIGQGVQVGSPTGGDKGAGTLNATGLYLNGTAIGTTVYAAKTTGYTIAAADNGGVINFTTAGVTCAFTAAATLGSGFRVTIKNGASTGNVTLDPDSAETLDGLATRILEPGNEVTIVCTGTAFLTIGGFYTKSSTPTTLSATPISTAHGFPRAPTFVLGNIICKTIDGGWQVGDIVNTQGLYDVSGTPFVGSNTTNFYINGSTIYQMGNRSTGANFSLTAASWNIQAIAFDEY